jgi:hypothetical protein
MGVLGMQAHPQAFQVNARARMILVLVTPIWILQTRPRVEQVGVMLQTCPRVL